MVQAYESPIDQAQEDRAHAETFDKFSVLVAMGGCHVAIILTALALAFLAGVPLIAIGWAVAAHIVLAVGVMRAWGRPPAPSLSGVVPRGKASPGPVLVHADGNPAPRRRAPT